MSKLQDGKLEFTHLYLRVYICKSTALPIVWKVNTKNGRVCL